MPVEFKDYYDVLGVSRTASPEEIKQAFRKLARIHHPDVAKDKASGEAKFKTINEAYEVLGDPEKRRRYDELGANWDQRAAPPPPDGPPRWRTRTGGEEAPDFEFDGTGFSDFFESFFGGGRGTPRHRGFDEEAFPEAGGDVEADLMVTLEEALNGSLRKVTLRRSGTRGEAERTNTYQVRIPPGVREGQRIRLAGQGNAGSGRAPAGDLFLRVRLARHPDFIVQGSDLYGELDVAPWEAVLGAQATFPTLDGATTLRILPGTEANRQFRLRGLGLPRENGGRGDLYVAVRIQVPPGVSDEERAAWKHLAEISTFKPRSSP